MSESPTRLPPPSNPALLPILAAGVFLAALVAVWGILSVLLDRDVVDYPSAGPILGPAMALAAGAVTWRAVTAFRSAWMPVVFAVAAAYVAMAAVGSIAMTVTHGDLTWLPVGFAHFAISPFTIAAAVLAGAVVALFRALGARGGAPGC